VTLDEELAAAPDPLKVKEAAKLARIGENQMYELVRRGVVYGAKCGKSIRIPQAALRRHLLGPHASEVEAGARG